MFRSFEAIIRQQLLDRNPRTAWVPHQYIYTLPLHAVIILLCTPALLSRYSLIAASTLCSTVRSLPCQPCIPCIWCQQKQVFFVTLIHVQCCHIISTPKNKHLKRAKSIIRSNSHWSHTLILRALDAVMYLSALQLIFHNCVMRTLRNTRCSRQNIIKLRNAQWPAYEISTWTLIMWD
jgi:hypothetical protein